MWPTEPNKHTEKGFGISVLVCSECGVGHSWIEQPIFFVDFEGSIASGILEYGVVTVVGGQVIETATRLCAPTGQVREEDIAVHGLRETLLSGHPAFAADWDFFAGLRERGPLAAHYAGAENSLLKSVWPYPRSSPDFVRPGAQATEWGPWIDSARIFAQLYPQLESGRLEAVVAACGLQSQLDQWAEERCPPARRHYHAALYDALAGAALLTSLAREPAVAGMTVMQLLALSTLDGEKRDAMQQGNLF